MRIKYIILFLLFAGIGRAQVELVPPSHQVYDFLKRLQLLEVITDYNSAVIPVSREKVARYLITAEQNSRVLSATDRKMLDDYRTEFEYDMKGTLKNASDFFSFRSFDIFRDDKQKYLYSFSDSNASFFLDGTFSLSYRGSDGDSIGINSIVLGELGLRVRGTLFDAVGFYLRASNGQVLKGDSKDKIFAANNDPKLKANTKFYYEGKNFDTYEGYLRYRTKSDWFAVTAGREAQYNGNGYIDRIFLSRNTVPFSFIMLDLAYKKVSYKYFYGSLKGDSLGRDLSAKNIAQHRLDIQFSKRFRIGFTENVITTEDPFNFALFNPLSFLTSADLNEGARETSDNNTQIGLDFEVLPVKTLALQGSLLIDDLNFESIFKDDSTANDNKFGYQLGASWTDAFTLRNLGFSLEYTHLQPFVYSHRRNKSTYTHWGLSLGHSLPPNSDEIALKLSYNVYNRLKAEFTYKHQRSGEGIVYDSLGKIQVNYGGYINLGSHDYYQPKNEFLQGNRINRDIFELLLTWQPIRQYFIEILYNYRITDLVYLGNRKLYDSYWWVTLRVDY